MFGSKRRKELEAIRVRNEAQVKATEKADKETARKFQARMDAAVKRDDFPVMKAIAKEARAQGFVNHVMNNRIGTREWEEQKQRNEKERVEAVTKETARRAKMTEHERHTEDSLNSQLSSIQRAIEELGRER